jgi:hypothetical protein
MPVARPWPRRAGRWNVSKLLTCPVLPVLLGALALSVPAAAGEFYEGGRWQDAQKAASESGLVVRAKVVRAGKPKGKGWDGNREEGGPPYLSRIDIKQEAVAEVREVLAGSLDGGTKEITVTLSGARLEYRPLTTYWLRVFRKQRAKNLAKGRRSVSRRALSAKVFALQEGTEYVFFLKAPKVRGKGARKAVAAAHLGGYSPLAKPEKDLLRSVRAFCEELKLWHRPPQLPPEQQRAVTRLIADLGAEDFATREKADRALRATGARLKPQLEAAARDGDEERSFRAAQILKTVCPEPGKVEFPKTGGRRLPAIFKKRPKPKPKPKPDPGAEPPDEADRDAGADAGPAPGEEPVPGED